MIKKLLKFIGEFLVIATMVFSFLFLVVINDQPETEAEKYGKKRAIEIEEQQRKNVRMQQKY